MLLSIDIGNTYIKTALFDEDDNILSKFSISSAFRRSSDEYGLLIDGFISEYISNIDAVVICSVVPSLTKPLFEAAEKISGTKPFLIASGTKTGFKIKIYDASELGADIVSNVAASRQVSGYPQIIVDAGTATTFTVVDRSGDVIGTLIHPGLKICIDALALSAAKLSEETVQAPRKLIGQNSTESIQSGVIYGHAAMIDGIISKICDELKEADADKPSLIITGENADIITPFCNYSFICDPDLTLKGGALLYRLNRRRS